MPKLYVGDPAPWFRGETVSTPSFNFSLTAGRYVCLFFMESSRAPEVEGALKALAALRATFNDITCAFFGVSADPADRDVARLGDQVGVRWFLDPERTIAKLYEVTQDEAGRTRPYWVLLDPTLRALAAGGAEEFAGLVSKLAGLPNPALHAGIASPAPVLVIPRVFEPEFCKALIGLYEAHGGQESGFMREIDGKTVSVSDTNHKQRTDHLIEDEAFREAARARVLRRIVPEIGKVFQFEVTRMERYLVGCYDAQAGGHFRAHRDNTTKGTAHRRFAVTINLNADDYEGGELRFPEFGPQTFKPPTGGAVIFSCSLLHEATRVTRGRRFAFLPFLYDEAAARIRETNNPHLDAGIGQYKRGDERDAAPAEAAS